MAGRPRKLTNVPKKAPIRKNNVRTLETRGIAYKEPAIIGSFWRDYTMDQIQNGTEEQVMEYIDQFLERLIARAKKNDKNWDFPIKEQYLRIAFIPKK